ncbi:MAG: porin family protein [Bacteroidales bacterium]|nr:porin family protein [Bacteroidales bacterium]
MKKFVTLIFIIFFFKLTSQIIEEGNVIIDVYYGWPNLWTNFAKNAVTTVNSQNVSVSTIGPLGARAEYMVSDKIGWSAEFNYSTTSIKFNEETTDQNNTIITYYYKFSIPRFRALFRFNYHFGQGKKYDSYFTAGLGYYGVTYKYETNDPNSRSDYFKNWIPVTYRIGLGGRLFFSENFGLAVELGLGGPLMTFGLFTKF